MVETFVTGYIERAMGPRDAVKIEPNAIFMAMRFAGLKASRQTLERVLAEMVSNKKPQARVEFRRGLSWRLQNAN